MFRGSELTSGADTCLVQNCTFDDCRSLNSNSAVWVHGLQSAARGFQELRVQQHFNSDFSYTVARQPPAFRIACGAALNSNYIGGTPTDLGGNTTLSSCPPFGALLRE